MANALFPKGKQALLNKEIDMDTDDIRVILVDLADYTYSSAHDFLDDVVAGARVAVSANLANKTITNGVFDADDVTFSSVTGDVSEALIIYRHTGTEATSHLIAFFDTGVTGLPVTPNGGNITVAWSGSGIFAL
jgi:hypothetical protein